MCVCGSDEIRCVREREGDCCKIINEWNVVDSDCKINDRPSECVIV